MSANRIVSKATMHAALGAVYGCADGLRVVSDHALLLARRGVQSH